MKSLRAIIVALLAIFALSSCDNLTVPVESETDPSETVSVTIKEPTVYDEFSLAYNGSKSLNPFTTDSLLNIYISKLVTESLVALDKDSNAEMRLCTSVTPNEDNTVYTVSLKNGILFSDGTPLTAQDVVSSAISVKANKDGYYYKYIKNVEKVYADEEGRVVFELILPDGGFERMLVFPIVREGSRSEDYIAAGAYMLDVSDGASALVYNSNYSLGDVRSHKIALRSTNNANELHYMLEKGEIDYYYTEDSFVTTGSFSGGECVLDKSGYLFFSERARRIADVTNTSELVRESGIFAEPCLVEGSDPDTVRGDAENEINLLMYYVESKNAQSVARYLTQFLAQYNVSLEVKPFAKEKLLISESKTRDPDIVFCEYTPPQNGSPEYLLAPQTGLLNAFFDTQELWDKYINAQADASYMPQYEEAYGQNVCFIKMYMCKAKCLYSRLFAQAIEMSPYEAYYKATEWYLYE